MEEIKEYAQVFWERYTELDGTFSFRQSPLWALTDQDNPSFADHERFISKIEAAESKREGYDRQTQMIKRKVEEVQHPLQQLKIVYANQTKGKSYSEDEDRFLLVEIAKYGVGQEDAYERIKRDINEWPAFRFDWFMKSVRRTSSADTVSPDADATVRSRSARRPRSPAAARP